MTGSEPPEARVGGPPEARVGGPPEARVGGPPEASVGGPPEASVGGPPEASVGGPPEARVGGPAAEASVGGPLRVAVVVTRLEGGAGVLALRGAQAMAPEVIRPTIVTGSGSRRLLGEAAAAGVEVVVEPLLREVIAPRSDLMAVQRLDMLFRERNFDVVHTHCAKAGAVGRVAARRAGTPRIVHTFHGFRFTSSSRRRGGGPT